MSDYRVLTGKELKVAAKKGLRVRYVESYFDPQEKHRRYNKICKMEKAKVGYYIGNSDIDPDEYLDRQLVAGDFGDGLFGVYAVEGVKYE